MTAGLLIHATLTVSGDPALLPAADARIKRLLAGEDFADGFEEHHGDAALSYDFKVRGGIPFPAFAMASQEFPDLAVTAEWVNIAAGRKGRARIAGGRIVEHAEETLVSAAAETRNRYVGTAADGRLRLALAVLRLGPGEWAGYALNHERDALFHLLRTETAIELRATEGEPEWSVVWRLRDPGDTPRAQPCMKVAVDPGLYAELERLARDFTGEWIWMRQAPAVETALERERYARHGYPVHEANVRASRLQNLCGAAGRAHDTLDEDNRWVRDVLLRCWAVSGRQ